jgi:hypothetical protein
MATPSFYLAWRTAHLPKEGHAPEEYEDAFAGDLDGKRFAVADGASESAFAGPWARLLVQAYVRKGGSWSAWLPLARRRWRRQVHGRDLPWYAQSKVEEGAFAALVGLVFHGNSWSAEGVGDSCLFQIRRQRLRRAVPIQRSADFHARPNLLGSLVAENQQPKTRRFRLQGHCHAGDVFFLMTDALAQWFLGRIEAGQKPWKDLLALEGKGDAQFASWVKRLRQSRELRNDDVTLLCIQAKATV